MLAFSRCLQGGTHSPMLCASPSPRRVAPLEAGSIVMEVMASPASSPAAVGRYGVQLQPTGPLQPTWYGTRGQQQGLAPKSLQDQRATSRGRNGDNGDRTEEDPKFEGNVACLHGDTFTMQK